MAKVCSSHKVAQHFTPPHTPELNPRPERAWLTLTRMSKAMLLTAAENGLPNVLKYWFYANKHAGYICNVTPSSFLKGKIPYEEFTGIPVDREFVRSLPPFGARAFVHVETASRRKSDLITAKEGVFVGVNANNNTYNVYLLSSKTCVSTAHVRFGNYEQKGKPDLEMIELALEALIPEPLPAPLPLVQPEGAPAYVNEQLPVQEQAINPGHDQLLPEGPMAPVHVPPPVLAAPVPLDTAVPGPPPAQAPQQSGLRQSARAWAPTEATLQSFGNRRTHRAMHVIADTFAQEMFEEAGGDIDVFLHAYLVQTCLSATTDPITMQQALRGPDADQWRQAIEKELATLKSHDTMVLVQERDIPPGTKVLSSKFVFKTKGNNGNEVIFKARLVVGGHRQIPGLHFNIGEIYSPVITIATARMLLSFAASSGWSIRHSDVQAAFVQAPLDDVIFIRLPTEQDKKGDTNVYRLLKSLYGIRQAPRVWYKFIQSVLRQMGFIYSLAEPCLFVKDIGTSIAIALALIVDDLLEVSPNEQALLNFEEQFQHFFVLSSTGPISLWNGIKVTYDQAGRSILLSQRAHIEEVLRRFDMFDCSPQETPSDSSSILQKSTPSELLEDALRMMYMSMVGALMYMAVAGIPEIQFAVNQCAAFMQSPGTQHLVAAKRILRYLKGLLSHPNAGAIRYRAGTNLHEFSTYSDASWGGDMENARSTTGTIILFNNGPVTWQSKRQQTTALSSAESEYMALADTMKQVLHLIAVANFLHIPVPRPFPIQSDSQSAIHIAGNPVSSQRTRHINVRYHFLREHVESGDVVLQYRPTNVMWADIFTKALAKIKFNEQVAAIYGGDRV